jgi:3-methylcrotonyl-CoA carboxylase alpha subunit
LQQADLQINGHAIEARICAENPDNNFLPATGTLAVYALPPCTQFERADQGVRVDGGVRAGDAISPYYDSMIAKLIVHGSTREQALARLDAALAQTHIVGLQTNVQFLRHVVQSESFAQAKLDTALIPREAAVLFNQERVGLPRAVAVAVASCLLAERGAQTAHPFDRADGWRAYGRNSRRFAFEFHGERLDATLTYLHDGALNLALSESGDAVGVRGALSFASTPQGLDVEFANHRFTANFYQNGSEVQVFTSFGATKIVVIDLLAHAAQARAHTGRLTAPMPGKMVSFAVKAGDAVSAGQVLAVMEAMKMEHAIAAPKDGVVDELLFAPGDQVPEGAPLISLRD